MARIAKKSGTYHHGDLRRALLDAAVKVVEKDGVSALTFQTLARRAGVSSGAPYHHFENREQLLAAIAQEGLALLVKEMTRGSAESGADARSQLEGLGRGYVRFALSHRGHFRVMFRPELRQFLGKDANKGLGDGLEIVRQAIVRCQEEGSAPKGDVSALVLLAWSAVHGASHLWTDGSLREEHLVEDAEALAATVAGTLSAILAGAAASRS
jgi:AcrR family transcriptional regulator